MDKATETITDMIIQRGYNIIDTDEKIIGINKKNEKIIFFMNEVTKFNSDRAKEYIVLVNSMGINHCIVVYTDCVTPMASKLLACSFDITLELFHIDELQYNITRHRLVPQHIKLSDYDAKQFKKKYGSRLPIILETDPIARFYKYKIGDIIKIIRKNNYVTYRIVNE